MIQRILELAEQAGAVFEQTNGLNDCPQDSLVGDEIEKFAELIVRECAKSLWTEECHNSDLALEEFERNSAKIREHFGVEE